MKLNRVYEEVEDILKFITTSGVRIKMMMSLMEKPKTSSQLRDEFGIGTSTIIHAARDLERENILIEKSDGYHLTNIGRIFSTKLLDFVKLLAVTRKNIDFWLSHDIEGIPYEFLQRLGELQDLKLIKSSATNILQTLSFYLKIVSKTKDLKGVSPIFVTDYAKIIKKILKRGAKVELVITKEILQPVIESYRKGIDKEVLEKVRKGNLKVWMTDETVKIAMTVTESFVSIGLFNLDGTYDFTQDLVSYDKEAIKWGRELFEYYKSRAREVPLD